MTAWSSPSANSVEQMITRIDQLATRGASQQQLIGPADSLFTIYDEKGITDEAVVMPVSAPRDSLLMWFYYWTAEWYFATESWQASIDYMSRAIPLAQRFNDSVLLGDCYHRQGVDYFRLGEFEHAAHAFHACYEIDKVSGDDDRLSSTLNAIAGTYLINHQYAEAERYILEAIEVARHVDNPQRMAILLGTASEVYHGLDDDLKTLNYAEQAYAIDKRLGNKGGQGKRLSQMATAFIGLNRDEDALRALDEAIPLLTESGILHSVAICERQYGIIEAKRGNMHSAAEHHLAAAEIFRAQGDKYSEMKAVKDAYEATRGVPSQQSIALLERYNELRDSVYQAETTEALNRYNAEYNVDQMQAERERERAQNRRYMMLTIAVIVLMSILILSVWYFIHRRSHAERDTLRKNIDDLQEINEKLNTWYNNMLYTSGKPRAEIPQVDKDFLDIFTDMVNRKMEEGDVSVERIASSMNISAKQLRTRLVELTGQNPRDYISNMRMQKAKYLITERRDLQVLEVARLCGYDDLSTFVHAFKKYFNLSPTAMREQKTK